MSEAGLQVRASIGGGETSVSTGLPVLDHLLELLARYGGFGLRLEVAPGGADEEVAAAGRALGEALRDWLHGDGARGFGSGTVPADEALAHVAVEASGRPLVVSNAISHARTSAGCTSTSWRGSSRALRGRRPHRARAPARGRRRTARPRSDLQVPRRRARAGGPAHPAEGVNVAEKTPIRTEAAPAPFQGAPYSQAVRVGDLVFVSGQLALLPDHAEIQGETIQEQTSRSGTWARSSRRPAAGSTSS